MVERTALTKWLGPPSEEVWRDFIDEVPKDGGKPDAAPIKSVWRSSGLAAWDRHVAGKLSEHTDRSLRHTLTLLGDEGFFRTIRQVEIPYITTNFELTVQAARAVAAAPGWLAHLTDADLLARVERMKKFLREHEPVNDYELALKLQLAALMPDLVPEDVRAAATAMLWRQQQPDGGWSTRRMSDLMKWHETMDPKVVAMIQGEPDAASPASDPYMTAFAIVLLRESGVPASDARIQRGVAWLKGEQRGSGRWWMKSLYRDTLHYITYISTAQALRALALCDALPSP
jgi:squalene-hopene/tetraprenyl-beta-curcumene cyclase